MKRINSIINTSIGNILEWYDFGLFSIFSSLFSVLFFPSEDPRTAIITTFSIFAIGFFCRPLGALLFGYLGDKTGRAKTLRLSILMISLPTLCIGFLPTYDQVGFIAPVCLLIARMWQGISIGGEYSGSLIYLAESAPDNRRAFMTSFASMGANIGILLAALVGVIFTTVLNDSALLEWGWRLPYLISGIFSLIIYYFRLNLQETPIFKQMKQKKVIAKNPIRSVFKNNRFELLRTFGMVCMGCTFYYFIFVYLPLFIEDSHNISLQLTSVMMSYLIASMVVVIPFAALLCDKFGRRKMLLFNSITICLILLPGFYFLQLNNFYILATVLTMFTFASAFEQAATTISVIENFPATDRYIGVSISYNLANGFLGGTVPLVCEWLRLTTNVSLAPALYVFSFAMITFLVVYYFVPETKHKSLFS